jgi:uncharacterized phage protein gp47/JayE
MPTRRNYANIYQDGRTRIINNTPVSNFNPQGITKAFLDILALEMERVNDNIEYIYRSIDPTRAVGRDLDRIGFLVGEQRKGSQGAADFSETNFFFYIDRKLNWSINQLIQQLYTSTEINVLETNGFIFKDENGAISYFTIPAGTVISNSNQSINYTTVNPVNLVGTTDAYVPITAVGTGPSYNVESNTIITHSLYQTPELRKLAKYIKCTNNFPIQNGSYSQTDEEYRYNIVTAKAALPANELSIRRTALSIPGVRDILFEKNKFGAGTVHIIVDGVSPLVSTGLIATVKQATQTNASYGDIIFVSAPDYLGVELNFSVRLDPTVTDPLTIRNQVRASLISYINSLPIGAEIVWNRIVSIALETDGVIDFIPNFFKYGVYDPINKINKEQIILNFINQRARYNEKWYTDSGLVSCCIA